MAKRTGTNKGFSALRGTRQEYLRHVLSPKGAAANFSQDDDQSRTVVADNNFPRADECIWRLQSAAAVGGTRLTVLDDAGKPLTAYSRVVAPDFISSYEVCLVFGTAVGYTLKVDHCASDGTVIENIVDVKYTDGAAGESAPELVQLDLEQA